MSEQWLLFVQEKWWILAIAAVALIVIVSVVKTVIKWVAVIAIIVGVLLYGSTYKDELTAMSGRMLAEAKDLAYQAILEQALNATYESHEDGTYTVYTDSVRVEGEEGSNEITLYWKDMKVGTFQIDDTIRAFMEQAKQN